MPLVKTIIPSWVHIQNIYMHRGGPQCDTFVGGLVWCFAFLALVSYFLWHKNYSFVENCVHGRRPNWLIKQTSNAHNSHASPESKFEPDPEQEPPPRGIRQRTTAVNCVSHTNATERPRNRTSRNILASARRPSDALFSTWLFASPGDSYSFRVQLGSRALALSSGGSQLVAIWPANYLHITTKNANNEHLISSLCIFCRKWKNMACGSRSSQDLKDIFCKHFSVWNVPVMSPSYLASLNLLPLRIYRLSYTFLSVAIYSIIDIENNSKYFDEIITQPL